MIRAILKWLIVAIVVILIIFWFLGGGVSKLIGNARSFSFSFGNLLTSSSSLTSFHLPFAPDIPQIPAGGEVNGPLYQEYGGVGASVPNGAQSPYAGQIVIAQNAAIAQSASAQYIQISAAPGGWPIDIAGWKLQSALSGSVATIPQAASPFIVGRVNAVGGISLSGGGIAVVVTGPSPVGVSFLENMCTGYLGTLQPFVPPLPQTCPSAAAEIPRTAANIARLGSSCMDYIAQIPPCTFPSNPPSALSGACRTEIQTKLSYNGCVSAHRDDANFSQNSWRVYLAQGKPLWNAQHDVIRLLDGEGRVVSVLNY